MNHQYPYIQTLSGIDECVGAYAIQPISEDETAVLPEENPILAFGPLGMINIFVGATNAGKSRFLRTLAKCESYGFYVSSETHTAASDLISSLHSLANSTENLGFAIRQSTVRMTDGSPVVLHDLPKWAKESLKGVQAERDYEIIFNAQFFAQHISLFEHFLLGRLGGPVVNVEKGIGFRRVSVVSCGRDHSNLFPL